ncbi:WD repeat protein [Talaromyces stipitatus ATCC 10500]|uniref:WD repeat protein n=1 Tax=Talaromyces stipitatus (strain ATCC 10500 / CBS 375.48 / QM 6759 / NRRL 1006) TaxID=441959 RepID=B8MMM3_TALSN|nr:WD repeat protein [Talaromyces stipitatus ATCC 10500]EED13777.1 WD repeat protein [Talaromyces stipitatus ATCC 10500]
MADRSSPPSHRSGSDDLSDEFHPAFEYFNNDEYDDNDDMDYEPPRGLEHLFFDLAEEDVNDDDDENYEEEEPEESEDDDEEEDEGHGENRVYQGNIQIELTVGPMGDEQTGDDEQRSRQARATTAQVIRLLGGGGFRRLLQSRGVFGGGAFVVDEEDDENDDDDFGGYSSLRFRRRRRNRTARHAYPNVPSENGIALMNSGLYGNNPNYVDEAKRRKKKLATRIMWRELGIGSPGERKRDSGLVFQDLIPSTTAEKIIYYNARCYSGQFSDDGNFFFNCGQDFRVRMYDTANPHDWKYYKTVRFIGGQWTITDATLSPDNRYLAASSIQRQVTLAATDPNDKSEPMLLDFSANRGEDWGGFGIWSLRFSGDGREIVAGTSDKSVVVYDIETQQGILRLRKHDDDVNAVCYGDSLSPHILYSGSDDTTIRVWDRRSMNDSREAGAFVGHTEGLTYVDSKGDGRYVLSNGKDQTMKLWDLRKMVTTEQFDKINITHYTTGFDYRYMPYHDEDYTPHPHDCSVVTYRGHQVLQTLIRCHFSPPSSTNSRYVYTGSADGKVYIYNIDATLAAVIDVGAITSTHREPRELEDLAHWGWGMSDNAWRNVVRDASWHPSAPVLAATSWNGYGASSGTCTVHSWNDSAPEDEGYPPMGLSYDEKLKPSRRSNRSSGGHRFVYDSD